ncbi:MAG: hypothetical protein JWP69_2354 [Flaviaesturariibacter sp.]|nr:hypothetical protein [Flaviaesturariibacter sp.]
MKPENQAQDKAENTQSAAAPQTGGGDGGKVDLSTINPTETVGDKTGEGDKTDTEEMHQLDNE